MTRATRRGRRAAALALATTLGAAVHTVPLPAAGEESALPLHLVGGLHTHTGYSDGAPETRPADAYARAREVEGLDFMAVTEHSEALRVPMTLSEGCLDPEIARCASADPDPTESLDKWDAQRRQAVAETGVDDFAALRGFEWTNDVFGHINVYFSRNFVTRLETAEPATVEAFYQWLRTPAFLGGGDDGVATFNHPGDKCLPAPDPRCNWNDFAYAEDLDGTRIVGIEIYNRAKNYEDDVVRALDKGWHLGLVGAEDIHEDDWGADRYAKTVMLAPSRSPADLKEAMRARRIYATLDHDLRIDFTGAGKQMGSRISTRDETVPLVVSVTGGDVARIDLLSNAGAVVATANGRSLAHDAPVAPGKERWYLARVVSSTGARTAYTSPIWTKFSARKDPRFEPRWVAGDLHVHTTWSHDSFGGIHDDNTGFDEIFTLGWTPGEQISIAESRGLDFVAITDHNDTRSVYDPGFSSGSLTLVPAYENSLAGHAQMIGAVSCYLPEGRITTVTACSDFPNKNDRARVRGLAGALRSDGGSFQVNHPSDGDWLKTFGDGSHADPIVPDSVEVWNIGPWHYQPPAEAANDNDFSLAFWETYLNAGFRVGATGGGDNHWRSTTAVQGVGQPTTWVYVTKPGVAGIVEGIRAGRTTVSHEPPALGGPQLFLEADADADGEFEAILGDAVPPGAPMRIRATNLPPGAVYRIVTDAGYEEIAAAPEVVRVVPDARWVRVELRHPDAQEDRRGHCDPIVRELEDVIQNLDDERTVTYCRNRLLVEALTSALYVAGG